MSWSTSASGKVEMVRDQVITSLDVQAKNYHAYRTRLGDDEAKDIDAAKERILATLDGFVADHSPTPNVSVSAYGSRNGSQVQVSINVSCATGQ